MPPGRWHRNIKYYDYIFNYSRLCLPSVSCILGSVNARFSKWHVHNCLIGITIKACQKRLSVIKIHLKHWHVRVNFCAVITLMLEYVDWSKTNIFLGHIWPRAIKLISSLRNHNWREASWLAYLEGRLREIKIKMRARVCVANINEKSREGYVWQT